MAVKQGVAAIALATLVLSAGCSGLLPGNDSTTTPTAESSAAITADGELDTAALLAMHNETVRAGETYTRVASLDGVFSSTTRLDVASGTLLSTIESATDGNTTDTYIDDTGTQYIRQQNGPTTNYYVIGADENPDTPESVRRIAPETADHPLRSFVVAEITATTWTRDGNISHDGTTVTRFTASGLDTTTRYNESSTTSYTAELLVEPGRAIRQLNVTVVRADQNGEEQRFSTAIRYMDFGSTTVEEPDWTDEASSQASGS